MTHWYAKQDPILNPCIFFLINITFTFTEYFLVNFQHRHYLGYLYSNSKCVIFCRNALYCNTIHLLHAGEGNMNIYSPKSIIFPEGNARRKYDTRERINFHISLTRML